MAQHDQVIDNGPGLTVRTDFNAALAALFSSSSGPVEPSVTTPGQLWFNTAVPGTPVLNVRNDDDDGWIEISIGGGGGGTPLSTSGGTMTGDLVLYGSAPATAASAVPRSYVDNVVAGLDVKASVKAASTANLGLTGTSSIDGVTINSGDRILVKNQTAPAENGIYIAAASAWARAGDMNAWTEVPGAFVFVEQGTAGADRGFVATADQGGTLGTTAIAWTQFAGTGSYQGASSILTSIAAIATSGFVRLVSGVASVIDLCTAALYRSNGTQGLLSNNVVWSAADMVTIAKSGSNLPIDLSTFINGQITIDANLTLVNPSNAKPGQSGIIEFTQDGTGGRTLTLGTNYKTVSGNGIALSAAAGAVDTVSYFVKSSTHIKLSLSKNWS